MEKLIIILVIAIASAIHSWWKKKQGEGDADEDSPVLPRRMPPARPGQRPAPPVQRSPAANWEEEIRRMLQGEEAPAPAPRSMAPPPVVVAAPPPLPSAPRPVVRASAAPKPHLAHSQIPIPLEGDEETVGLPVKMPTLEQSAQAYLRASKLNTTVAQHLQQIEKQVIEHQALARLIRAPSPEVSRALGMLRDRSSQRSAILTSIILGPPQALAEG